MAREDFWSVAQTFGMFGTIGAIVALMPRRAQAMTDIAAQDTSNVPRASNFNADFSPPEILQALSPIEWDQPDLPLASEAANYALSYDPLGNVISQGVPSYSWLVSDWASETMPYLPLEDIPLDDSTGLPYALITQAPDMNTTFISAVKSFCFMIRCCEHRYPADVMSNVCYGLFFSGISGFNAPQYLNQIFTNFIDHPAITGVCLPVPLPDAVCLAAGLSEGCVSSAAGGYQVIRPTWMARREAYTGRDAALVLQATGTVARLPDFTPDSQDQCAVRILAACGALAHIAAGNFNAALSAAAPQWASLPGSRAQQNPKQMTYALDRFNEGQSMFA